MKRRQHTTAYLLSFFLLFILSSTKGQETNAHASGKVLSDKSEAIAGATVTVIHELTQSKYVAATRNDGYFHFFNLKPGGPYRIVISSVGYESDTLSNLDMHLSDDHFVFNNSEMTDFVLRKKVIALPEVIVKVGSSNKTGTETNINEQQILSLPSISRNLQDYVRLIPHAKVNGNGGISLAGQNTRFNAFFIDGANNKDINGSAASGTNGGATGSPPISMDAIEEIQVLLAPYNVQYSNFTGGSVNAITRSGTNDMKGAAWYYFRNENLTGRSPVPIEKTGSPGVFEFPKLSPFLNQQGGGWLSGPVIKNKLFYFLLAEKQSEVRPEILNLSDYRGNSKQDQVTAFVDRLKNYYQYDPGTFLETTEKLNVTRLMLKADWNPSAKNKFTVTYRYNQPARTAATNSGSTVIAFNNSSFHLPTRTHTGTVEWKSFFRNGVSNRILFTFTDQKEDRTWKGNPFPRVTINDGSGTLRFGSGPSTVLNAFQAKEFSMSDILRFVKLKHTFTAGLDFDFSKIDNPSIENYFGTYQFRSLNDFMAGAAPSRYQRSFSMLDEPKGDNTLAGARYNTLRLGVFINDEISISTRLKVNIGLRADRNWLPTAPYEDKFFNDTAIKTVSQYYDLHGARAGQVIQPDLQVGPRIAFTYKPEKKLTISGGAGLFTGHILNAWNGFLHLNNGVSTGSIDINPQQYGLNFNPDPYNQPTPQTLGISLANAKGELNLISKDFKYPAVFRSSLSINKKVKGGWAFSAEGIFTKNTHETRYTNLNLLPPNATSSLPDKRNVYSTNNSPGKILTQYTKIYLLSNNHDKEKGSAYNLAFTVEKQFTSDAYLKAGYSYGKSKVIFDNTAGLTSYDLQWTQTESVNGRNFIGRSISDVDPGHRIFAQLFKKFSYLKNKMATSISLFYNGQSGEPFSYVYGGSIVNDNGRNENFDLIYIPTNEDLNSMNFIANPAGQSVEQQKELLNSFIEHDKYLRKHRGEFAERNGARQPFSHIVDLRLQQDFKVNINQKETRFSLIFDVFNFTNLLNKNWGRMYSMVDDKFSLIQFAGYANTSTLTPQYQFTAPGGTPYSIVTGTTPGSSTRWISQVGFRINFN